MNFSPFNPTPTGATSFTSKKNNIKSHSLEEAKKIISEHEKCKQDDITFYYNSDKIIAHNLHALAIKNMDITVFYHVKDKEASKVLEEIRSGSYTRQELIDLTNQYFLDDDIAMAALEADPSIFSDLDHLYKNDRDMAMQAVTQNPFELLYCSDELKNDKEVVLAAVKKDGDALAFASMRLKQDKNVVMEAVRNNGMSLQCAHSTLINNREVFLAAVKNSPSVFYDLDHTFLDDTEIQEIISKSGPLANGDESPNPFDFDGNEEYSPALELRRAVDESLSKISL